MRESLILQHALDLAEKGIPVFPCGDNKRPAISKEEGGRGFLDATTEPTAVRRLFRRWNAALIGMPTGAASGLDLLDIDPRHGGDEWAAEHAPYLGDTLTVQTRSGGTHFFYKHLDGVRNSESQIADGVDVRGEGGYAILWVCSGGFIVRDLPALAWPEWLATIAIDPPKRKKRTEGARLNNETLRRREYVPSSGVGQTIYVKRNDDRTTEEIALTLIASAIVRVERAPSGQRHYELRAASRMVGGLLKSAGISSSEAVRRLKSAVIQAGAEDEANAEKTIVSGLDLGGSEAFTIQRAA